MANIFYVPSGNPATDAEGLSSVIRAEFIAISLGFDQLPAFTTTGVFATTFNQQGSYTFTLPDGYGTLALTTDISANVLVETARATAAEGVNATAIAAETIIRGAAIGAETTRATAAEVANTTAIGAETTRAKAAEVVNTTAIGTETTRATAAEGANATAIATKQANLGFVPVTQGFAGNTVTIGWSGTYLQGQVDTVALGQMPTQNYPGAFIRNGDSASVVNLTVTGSSFTDGNLYASAVASGNGFFLVGTADYRAINWSSDGWKLYWNAHTGVLQQFTATGTSLLVLDGAGNFSVPGTVSGSNVSDARTKRAITLFRRGLADIVGLEPISYEYNGLGGTTDTGKTRWGVTAQQAQPFLPECVSETPEPGTDPTREQAPDKIRLDGQLSFDEQPLLYAMVNAFRDVAAELKAVKARLAVLEPR